MTHVNSQPKYPDSPKLEMHHKKTTLKASLVLRSTSLSVLKHLSVYAVSESFHVKTFSPCQSTEDVLDIRVVTTRFRDGDPQFSVAESADSSDDTCNDPDDESQAHGASILQHTLRTDEDP